MHIIIFFYIIFTIILFNVSSSFFVAKLLSKIAKIHTSLCNTDNFVFYKRFEHISSESILENLES